MKIKKKPIEIEIKVKTKSLDVAIKKVKHLIKLLNEVNELMNHLN